MHFKRWRYILPLRLRSLFHGNAVEQELDDEMRYHLDRQIDEHVAGGMTREEARLAALRAFGGVEQHKETARDARGVGLLEDLVKDARYALRQFLRTPVLTAAVVLSLALGIGANTAIFTAVDAVMLRALPVKDPHRVVMFTWSARDYPRNLVSDMLGGGRPANSLDNAPIEGMHAFSYATFEHVRDHSQVFSSTFAVAGNTQDVNAEVNGVAESATFQGVSGNYFQTLGVAAFRGRTLLPADDRESEPPVAVISYRFWKNKLGEDSSTIGRTMVVNGNPITIVGVAPPEFFGLAPGTLPDLWIPLSVYMSQQAYSPGNRSQVGNGPPTPFPYWKRPTTWWLEIFGRLNPTATETQARTESQALFEQSVRLSAAPANAQSEMPRLAVVSMKHGLDALREQYSTSLLLLMGVVGLVLMIACGNVAALLLARATTRQREIAVRLSLGAGRRRLVRQLLTESVMLAAMGGSLGLAFAIWADYVLVALLSSGRSPLNVELHLSGTVLGFTAVVSLLTGVLFGLLPALRATRVELIGAMRQGASRTFTDHRFRSGKLVVAAQIALCFVLVSSAGLLLRTLQNLHAIDAGFDPQRLLLFTVRPGLNGYKDDRLADYYRDLKHRIESIPGVESVSLATRGPVGQGVGNSGVIIPGYTPADQDIGINRHQIGPDYFQTLGIPLIRGRGIGEQDQQKARRVVVVNERLVQQFFHGDDPIGHHLYLGSRTGADFEIVGVARNVKYNRLQDDVPPTIYYSYLQFLAVPNAMVFEVRSVGDVFSLAGPIQREASLLDRTVPLTDIRTEAKVIDDTFVLERTFAALSAAFAALALTLVGVGLYGTIAYIVTRQTKDIGIRLALGARRQTILARVLGQTIWLLAAGLGAGVVLTLAATPLLKSHLFGLAANDAMTMAGAILVISAVTLAAAYMPARRASRIDPMVSLREE